MTSENAEYAKYECARCGRLAPRNELKVLKKWVPVSKTSGSSVNIHSGGATGVSRNTYGYVGGNTNYKRAYAFVCKRCPRKGKTGFGAFLSGLFKFVFWTVAILLGLFVVLVIAIVISLGSNQHRQVSQSNAAPVSSASAEQTDQESRQPAIPAPEATTPEPTPNTQPTTPPQSTSTPPQGNDLQGLY
jgi:hypothetical protein